MALFGRDILKIFDPRYPKKLQQDTAKIAFDNSVKLIFDFAQNRNDVHSARSLSRKALARTVSDKNAELIFVNGKKLAQICLENEYINGLAELTMKYSNKIECLAKELLELKADKPFETLDTSPNAKKMVTDSFLSQNDGDQSLARLLMTYQAKELTSTEFIYRFYRKFIENDVCSIIIATRKTEVFVQCQICYKIEPSIFTSVRTPNLCGDTNCRDRLNNLKRAKLSK